MRVRMRISRTYQGDFGIERTLEAGQEYDLPAGVAVALVATTAAVRAKVAPVKEETTPVEPKEPAPSPTSGTESASQSLTHDAALTGAAADAMGGKRQRGRGFA